MLNQKKSAPLAQLKFLLVIPITAMLLCISSAIFAKEYGLVTLFSVKNNSLKFTQPNLKGKEIKKRKSFNDLSVKENQRKIKPPTFLERKTREVLTTSKLIITELRPSKTNKDSVTFTAESKVCFQVVEYDNKTGKSRIILNWTICPDGKCPEMKQFKQGTLAYKQLNELIAKSKPSSLATLPQQNL